VISQASTGRRELDEHLAEILQTSRYGMSSSASLADTSGTLTALGAN